jgi:hypothetical protein
MSMMSRGRRQEALAYTINGVGSQVFWDKTKPLEQTVCIGSNVHCSTRLLGQLAALEYLERAGQSSLIDPEDGASVTVP